MRRDQRGHIVVETIGSFMMFVLLVVSILSLVNIVTLQARLHYALTQSAETLSLYSYVFKITGTAGQLEGGAGISAADFSGSMASLISGLEGLAPGAAGRNGEAAANIDVGWPDDPQEAMRLLLDYGLDESKNALAQETIIRPLLGRYLSNGAMSGDEYLRSVNVIGGLGGLAFSPGGSALVDENGDVKLVVNYEIAYKFGALPLPFGPKLRITQTAKTKAWLGGRGEGYAK